MKEQSLTWKKVTTYTLLAMIASWLLDLLFLVLRIRLQPNNIVAPNFLFFLVWIFPLAIFAKYFVSRPTGKRTSLILLFAVSMLLLCTNLMAIGPTFAEADECSVDSSGFTVSYKCICETKTIEWSRSYDCEYNGFRFIPLVQEK